MDTSNSEKVRLALGEETVLAPYESLSSQELSEIFFGSIKKAKNGLPHLKSEKLLKLLWDKLENQYGEWERHPSLPQMPNDKIHKNTRIIVQFQLRQTSVKPKLKDNDEDLEWIFITDTGKVLYCRQCHTITAFYLEEWNKDDLTAKMDSNCEWYLHCLLTLGALREAFREDSAKRFYRTQIMEDAGASISGVLMRISGL